MSLSTEQLKALDDLPAPDSLDRIIRFLSDLGAQGNVPLGETGRSAQTFVASLAGAGAQSFSARQTSGWVAILMDRYQIKIGEIQEFALWFVQRQAIFSETADVIEPAPEMTLARPTAAASLPDEPTASRSALRRLPVASPTPTLSQDTGQQETDLEPTLAAPPDERPSRRQTGRNAKLSGSTPRSRRVERGSAAPESAAQPAEEESAEKSAEKSVEEPTPAKRSFRLTPNMVTRPAFVTNVGLAGMLAGLSLASPSEAALAAPALSLASPAFSGMGPMPGMGPAYSSAPAAVPTVTPPFMPTVSPLMPNTPLPPSSVWLGMPSPPVPVPPSPVDAFSSVASNMTGTAPSNLAAPPNLAAPLLPTRPLSPMLSSASPPAVPQALDILPGVPAETLVGASPPVPAPSQVSPSVTPANTPETPGLPTGTDLLRPSLALAGLAAGSAALSMARGILPAPSQVSPGVTPSNTPEIPGLPNSLGFLRTGPALAGFMGGGAALSMAHPPQTLFSGGMPTDTSRKAAGLLAGSLAADAVSTLPAPPLMAATPEMGQLTLMAPPLQVASAQAERSGIAASMDWQTLAGGAGPLNESSLARLKQALPEQATVLYPALPRGSLSNGAVNLPLSASLVQSLLQKGYQNAGIGIVGGGIAAQAANLGNAATGGKPPAAPLSAQLVPAKRPTGAAPGVMGHPAETVGGAGALGEAGKGQATRGGVMDFLGLPIRLAPSLSGQASLKQDVAAHTLPQGPAQTPTVLRPEQFAPLRNRLFPAFQSMTVEPDKAAWRKAAPAFGLRDGKPTTLLSPDARIPIQTPTAPQPAPRSRPSLSSPAARAPGGPLAPPPRSTTQLPAQLTSQFLKGRTSSAVPAALAARVPSAAPAVPALPIGLRQTVPALHHTPALTGAGPHTMPLAGHHSAGHHSAEYHSAEYQSIGRPGVLHTPTARSGSVSHTDTALGGHRLSLPKRLPLPTPLPQHLPSISSPLHTPISQSPTSTTHSFGRGSSAVGRGSHSFSPGSFSPRITSAVSGGHSPLRSQPRSLASPLSRRFAPSLSQAGGSHGRLGSSPASAHLPRRTPLSPSAHSLGSGSSAPTSSGPTSQIGRSFPLASHQPRTHAANLSVPSPAQAFPRSTAVTPMHMPKSQFTRLPSATSSVFSPGTGNLRPAGRRRLGASVPSSFSSTSPAMHLAPSPKHRPHAETATISPLAVQRAGHSTTTAPTQNTSANSNSPSRAQATSGPDSAAAGEVNALAGEVWSLLKRRLATEAERRGRW